MVWTEHYFEKFEWDGMLPDSRYNFASLRIAFVYIVTWYFCYFLLSLQFFMSIQIRKDYAQWICFFNTALLAAYII